MYVAVPPDGCLLGHVGFRLRSIAVGVCDMIVVGTGGVLVRRELRGIGLGAVLMRCAQAVTRSSGVPRRLRAEFGYLGCRSEVVPSYQAMGWRRTDVVKCYVSTGERRVSAGEGSAVGKGPGSVREDPTNTGDPGDSRDGLALIVVSEGVPVLICIVSYDVGEWPTGLVNLRREPW